MAAGIDPGVAARGDVCGIVGSPAPLWYGVRPAPDFALPANHEPKTTVRAGQSFQDYIYEGLISYSAGAAAQRALGEPQAAFPDD